MNRAVGAVQEEVRVERGHVRSPAWWALQVVTFVLRLPLIVAGLIGADREKLLEKEVWPQFISSLLSIVVLALLAWMGLR